LSWCIGVDCPLGGRDGLVWCLLASEAKSLQAAYTLGRLITVCQPNHVVALVFPEQWARFGKNLKRDAPLSIAGWQPNQSPVEIQTDCAELLGAVTPDCPLEVIPYDCSAEIDPHLSGRGCDSNPHVVFCRRLVAKLANAPAHGGN